MGWGFAAAGQLSFDQNQEIDFTKDGTESGCPEYGMLSFHPIDLPQQ